MSPQDLESLPIIGEEQVAALLDWKPLIATQRQAMIDFSAGEVVQPIRQFAVVPGRDGILATMPAVGKAIAVKVVTVFNDNAGTNLPTHQAVILVFDKDNGAPLALLDGRLITEMRTAAASAAATEELATDSPKVVTIMGNGVQAKAHIEALSTVRSWRELRVWARNKESGKQFAEQTGAIFFDDAKAAVQDADIVACTTAATSPILNGAWLKPGAFVTAVGWNTPDGRELDDVAMANIVVVESVDVAHDQSGNVRGSGCEIFAEIGQVYSNEKSVPAGSTIIYDSVGMAIMDVAAAQLVYQRWLNSSESS